MRLLILDDSLTMANVGQIKQRLSHDGVMTTYQLHLYRDGHRRLRDICAYYHPNVVLCGVSVGEVPGAVVARWFRQHAQGIPIIFYSREEITAEERRSVDGGPKLIIKNGRSLLEEARRISNYITMSTFDAFDIGWEQLDIAPFEI